MNLSQLVQGLIVFSFFEVRACELRCWSLLPSTRQPRIDSIKKKNEESLDEERKERRTKEEERERKRGDMNSEWKKWEGK